MKVLWLVAAALCAVAGLSVWVAFQNPQFVAGLGVIALTALYKALEPALLKLLSHSPETDRETQEHAREGTETGVGKGSHHGGAH